MDTVNTVGLETSAIGPTRRIEAGTPPSRSDRAAPIREPRQETPRDGVQEAIARKREEDRQTVDQVLADLAVAATRLRINENQDAGVFVYQSIDPTSGEVIRQYPPDPQLKLLTYYREIAKKTVDSSA